MSGLALVKMRKSQVAMEMITVFSFMTFVLVLFVLVATNRMVEIKEQKDRILVDDLSFVIESEINFAVNSYDGYSRSFELPQNLGGAEYDALLLNSTFLQTNYSELIVNFMNYATGYEKVTMLPRNVTGNIFKGQNNITKLNGEVCINTARCPP